MFILQKHVRDTIVGTFASLTSAIENTFPALIVAPAIFCGIFLAYKAEQLRSRACQSKEDSYIDPVTKLQFPLRLVEERVVLWFGVSTMSIPKHMCPCC